MKTILQKSVQKAIEVEFDNWINATAYQGTPARSEVRNGSYERQLHTPVGTITLHICHDRDGEFSTTGAPRRRCACLKGPQQSPSPGYRYNASDARSKFTQFFEFLLLITNEIALKIVIVAKKYIESKLES
jgi:Transposase, Mutator family